MIEGGFIHPKDAFGELSRLLYQIGAKKILAGAGYQKDNEKFLASIFCFSIREFLKKECYFRQPRNDPPDFEMAFPAREPIGRKELEFTRVEIVEVPPVHDNESAEYMRRWSKTIIEKKLRGTLDIDESTNLLIFINTKYQKQAFYSVQDAIKNSAQIKYIAIWIMRIIREPSFGKGSLFATTHVYPERYQDIVLDPSQEAQKGMVYQDTKLEKYMNMTESE